MSQEQRDQQAAEPTVTVEKGVQCLELRWSNPTQGAAAGLASWIACSSSLKNDQADAVGVERIGVAGRVPPTQFWGASPPLAASARRSAGEQSPAGSRGAAWTGESGLTLQLPRVAEHRGNRTLLRRHAGPQPPEASTSRRSNNVVCVPDLRRENGLLANECVHEPVHRRYEVPGELRRRNCSSALTRSGAKSPGPWRVSGRQRVGDERTHHFACSHALFVLSGLPFHRRCYWKRSLSCSGVITDRFFHK